MLMGVQLLARLWLGVFCSGLYSVAVASSSPAVSTRCENIYRGFSDCLLALSTRMSVYTEQELNSTLHLDNICAHWDEFHACGMAAMIDCRVEVQAIWDSLRRESARLSFEGNLYEMCAGRTQDGRQDRLTAPSSSAWQSHSALLLWATILFLLAFRI